MKFYSKHESADFIYIQHDALCWCLALVKIICTDIISSYMCCTDIIFSFFAQTVSHVVERVKVVASLIKTIKFHYG